MRCKNSSACLKNRRRNSATTSAFSSVIRVRFNLEFTCINRAYWEMSLRCRQSTHKDWGRIRKLLFEANKLVHRDCVCFQIDKKLIAANKMEKRVREEVTIHSQLKHPSVLELYTFFEDKNYVYLVLELAHNGELQRYMKANQVTFTEEEGKLLLRNSFISRKYTDL